MLQFGRNVNRCAGSIKTINRIPTAFAQTDQTGMDPDAKMNRMSSRSGRFAMTLKVPGCDTRAIGMIFVRAWPAKYRDTTIACIVDDLSTDTFHRTTDVIQPLVQKDLGIIGIASRDVAG